MFGGIGIPVGPSVDEETVAGLSNLDTVRDLNDYQAADSINSASMGNHSRSYISAYWAATRSAYGQANFIASLIGAVVGAAALFGLSSKEILPTWLGSAWTFAYVAGALFIVLPYRMWKEQQAKIDAMNLPRGPMPDMPIKELFAYASDGVDLLNPDEENWRVLGRDVKDRLSTGQVNAWGRPREDKDAPLVSIEPGYWRGAEFSYYFLGDMEGPHAWTLFDIIRDERYWDIQLNRVQVHRIWPRPLQSKKMD